MKFKDNTLKVPSEMETRKEKSQMQILPHFWSLASLDESVRTKATIELITDIKGSKKQTTQDDLISTDLTYAVKRLVRGLASGRKGARQGFATALLEILVQFPEVTVTSIHECLLENLKVSKNMKGKEEGNTYFGQIFCYTIILQAFKEGERKGDKACLPTAVAGLVSLMGKKSYLRELCAKGIMDAIDWFDYGTFNDYILPSLSEILERGWKACTPEDLMILHKIGSCFKDQLPNNFFKANWKRSLLLDERNYHHMVKPLLDSTHFSHPRVHQVWDLIMPELISNKENFPMFWKQVVEDGLLTSTHERKYLAFQLLVRGLKLVTTDQVPTIFSPNLIKSIVNNCAVKDNFLHNAAKTALSSLTKELEQLKDPPKTLVVIFQFIERFGMITFDYITKTNTVESLIAQLDTDSLKTLFDWLLKTFNAGKISRDNVIEEDVDVLFENLRVSDGKSCQQGVAILMLSITKNRSEPKPEDVMVNATKFLFFHGYFTALKKTHKEPLLSSLCEHAPDESVRKLCQQRFHSALSELSGNHLSAKASTEAGSSTTLASCGMRVLKFAKWLIDHPKYVQMEAAWTPDIHTGFQNAAEKLSEMKEEGDTDQASTSAFQLLLLHCTLQLFSNTSEALEILEELQVCFEKSSLQPSVTDKAESEEPHWTEVISEILLSFQAQSSHLMRQITDRVFQLVLPHLTLKALDIILEAVKGKKGEDLSLEQEAEDEEEDDEFMPITEEDLKKKGEAEEVNESDEDDSDEEEQEEEEEEEEDESAMQIDEKFRADVKNALSKAVAKDESEDESSDESLDMDEVDPDALEAMDKALGAVFRTRTNVKSGKKKKQEEKKSIVHFRLRVLDFLEILIRKQPKNPLVLELPAALLEVISNCGSNDEKALRERAISLFRNKLCRLHVYPSGSDLNPDDVNSKVTILINMAEAAHTDDMAKLITGGIAYFIRVLRGGEPLAEPSPLQTRSQRKRKSSAKQDLKESDNIGHLNLKRVGVVLGRCLKNFMLRKKCQARPHLFSEIIARFPRLGWTMANDLAHHVSKAVNIFRKTQAWALTSQLLSRKTETYKESLQEISLPLLKSINEVLELIQQEDCKLKAKQLNGFVKLMDKYLAESIRIPEIWNSIDKDDLQQSIQAASVGPVVSRSTQMQAQFKKLIALIKGETISKKEKKRRKLSIGEESENKAINNGEALTANGKENESVPLQKNSLKGKKKGKRTKKSE